MVKFLLDLAAIINAHIVSRSYKKHKGWQREYPIAVAFNVAVLIFLCMLPPPIAVFILIILIVLAVISKSMK